MLPLAGVSCKIRIEISSELRTFVLRILHPIPNDSIDTLTHEFCNRNPF